MESLQKPGEVIRKMAGITAIGFLVVLLIGPILTVLGFVLPFALVGLMVYIPYRLLLAGKEGGWPAVQQAGRKAARTAVALPLWLGGAIASFAGWLVRTVFRVVGTTFRLVFAIGTGAAIGAILGVIGGMEYHDAEFRVPAGALIGATMGLVMVLLRSKPSRTVVPPAPQVERIHAQASC